MFANGRPGSNRHAGAKHPTMTTTVTITFPAWALHRPATVSKVERIALGPVPPFRPQPGHRLDCPTTLLWRDSRLLHWPLQCSEKEGLHESLDAPLGGCGELSLQVLISPLDLNRVGACTHNPNCRQQRPASLLVNDPVFCGTRQ